MRHHWLRTFTLALGLGLAALNAAQAAGYYYEAVTLTDGEKKAQRSEMRIRAWVDGPKAKIEFVTADKNPFFAPGSFLVTQNAAEVVYLVNTEEQTYAEFDLEKMLGTVGSIMEQMGGEGGMMKMEFADISSEKLLEESGGMVLGHSTTHHRYKSGYTFRMAVMGFKQESRVDMLQDVWYTNDYDAPGFGVWLRPDRRLRTGYEEFDKLLDAEWAKLEGFPLKTVVVNTTTSKKGKTMQTTSTTEVTTLREEAIPAATFEVPAGYRQVQILPEMPADAGF